MTQPNVIDTISSYKYMDHADHCLRRRVSQKFRLFPSEMTRFEDLKMKDFATLHTFAWILIYDHRLSNKMGGITVVYIFMGPGS